MKSLKENRKGITLVSLVITIVVLLILASIATYSGIEVIKSSRLTTFTTEMKIMQTQVNELYQRYKNGDNTVLDIGKDLGSVLQQANKAFNASGITEQSEYRYFDQNTIKDVLKIEGVEGEFFVNIKERSVVSYEGFKYEGKTYYTLDQLPNGLYNVEYNDKNINMDKPTFDTSVEKVSEGKWRVTVSNIQYNGYIDKWKVNYQLEGQDSWNTSEDLSFIATESGEYVLQLVNGNIKSDEKIITVKQGEILPAEYQQVEYIESTGTQYIDTNVVPDVNTGFYIDITILDLIDSNGKRLFGTSYRNQGFWGGIFIATYNATDGGQMAYINSGNFYNPCLVSNTRMQISLINQHYTTSTGADINFKTGTMNSYGSIYILNVNTDVATSTYSSAKLYKAQIYSGDVIIRNFIPCYRKSDNEIGMYDTVNNKFYTNQGTGTFEKGNDV